MKMLLLRKLEEVYSRTFINMKKNIERTIAIPEGVNVTINGNVGVATNNALYTLQVGSNPATSNGVGISSTGDIITSGIITATNGFTSGIGVTNPVKISVLGNQLTFIVNGVGSATLTLS